MAEFTSNSVEEYFKGKTILVTGATGFLTKVFVEKILRVQPNIKRLYLLVRASNPDVALQRLHTEVFGKELFKIQREKWGEKFSSFLSEKVVAVAGDVSLHNFGIKDQILVKEMLEEIEIIVHSAATVTFDERYDIAMGTNTMGAYNAINFAKMCPRIEVFLFVSTAYVCGNKAKGLIPEEPFRMGQTIKTSSKLDISLEKQLIEEKLSDIQTRNANEKTITSMMKELGTTRANLHGWQDTYAFTKAMGEMVVTSTKGNIPLIITRPTAIIGTHSEPFEGWIEGVRTIDFVFVEYFKGAITSFVGNPEIILDLIPVDMVANSMIIALLVHSKNNSSNNLIYHIGTSLRNPIKSSDLQDIMHLYITKNPWLKNYAKSSALYEKFTFNPNYTEDHEFPQHKISRLKRIINLYRPYFRDFEGVFDDKNTEKLRMAIKGVGSVEREFNLDPKSIDWKDYLMNVHFPGLVKYSMQPKM
ncbi:probable fatty acyl-CoA reductase 4 [Arachis ipaensis]|uniref:probable fatty acyl-CoA reductase 4 n=1 Tax=Arachis ipaensis TaxID=130454 RepID=UPI000A2B62C7|nr:probable fatty acyl-CoA reductase 4 [Arachis ipaensis]QHN95180.1 putative fatty acyl-CoA reductase [Arachis hypogaea]